LLKWARRKIYATKAGYTQGLQACSLMFEEARRKFNMGLRVASNIFKVEALIAWARQAVLPTISLQHTRLLMRYKMRCGQALTAYCAITTFNKVRSVGNNQPRMRRNTAKAYCALRIAPYRVDLLGSFREYQRQVLQRPAP